MTGRKRVNSVLCEDEERHWKHLFINFIRNEAPPTDCHERFIGATRAASDPDACAWEQAMASPCKEKFLEAAEVEIAELTAHGTWTEDLIANATARTAPSQWVFKIKRAPDGEVKKFEARLVLRGDLQECSGETFSPAASWSTVRIFLLTCMQRGWAMLTIDFSNAFVQSPLPPDEPA